ncbi:MAG: Na+/H+ antiporter subunit E [Clostridia bacterium]|nr:Na+/H+ antiporter subunit E [Clostridia bacterium]MBN2883208.1 Na+/H+ antiporter subunit E [Clostridia bacterium]
MKKYISNFIVCYAVWILLAGVSVPELVLGAVVSAVLAALLWKLLNLELTWKTPFALVLFIAIYLPVFLFELVKANIDVLFRVLNPKLPINPGFVKIKTGLKTDFGKLILANSITLTPGTISVDADDESIYVHWIDVKGKDHDEYAKRISGKFENILGRMSL